VRDTASRGNSATGHPETWADHLTCSRCGTFGSLLTVVAPFPSLISALYHLIQTKGGRGRGKKKAATEPDATTKEKAATQLSESLAKLNDLTDAASKLLDDGWVNIYDFTRERILSGLLEKDGATSPKQSLI